MVQWNPRFDVVCGANISDRSTEPEADSGLHDWLYGRAETKPEDEESSASPIPITQACASGKRKGSLDCREARAKTVGGRG